MPRASKASRIINGAVAQARTRVGTPAAEEHNPFAGVPDAPSPALPQTAIAPGDTIVLLRGCTLANYKLMGNGMGFDVHFTVPLNESEKTPALVTALQRMVDIEVTRYNRAEDPHRA